MDKQALTELLDRLEKAEGASLELDWAVAKAFIDPKIPHACVAPYTGSLNEAITLVETMFPAWFITTGVCHLTGHASIGPDYNGPEGDRLKREFPIEKFGYGFDADLAPGGDKSRACHAVLHCLVQAKLAT